MTSAVIAPLIVAVAFPLAAAAWALVGQLYAVQDRRRRTEAGWDARDTFEVKDALFVNLAFITPIMVGAAFVAAGLDWPRWAWWGALFALAVLCLPISHAYSRWSAETRKGFEVADADIARENGSTK